MRHIFQRYASDCFPTCIAMVADISHRHAMNLVHPFHLKGDHYTTYDTQAIRILRLLGFKVRKRYLKDFNKLKEVAILSLRFPGERTGHVAVWDPLKKKVLEPYRGYQYLSIDEYKQNLEFVYIIT